MSDTPKKPVPKMFYLQRTIEVPLTDAEGGEGIIIAKVLNAEEWLQFQIDIHAVDDSRLKRTAFMVRSGKSWVMGTKGVFFDDGTPLTAEDAGAFPAAVLMRVFNAVTNHVALAGKSVASVSTSDSAPDQPSETSQATDATNAATSPESSATAISGSGQVGSKT